MNLFKKGVLAATLAASAFATTTPAMAQDYRDRGDNTAAVAIGAGILGLAVGAIAASDSDDRYRDRRYYDRRYYDRRAYVNDGRYYRDNRRYYRNERNYDRSRYYDRSRRYDRDGWRGNDRRRYDNRYYGRRGY